MKSGTPNPAARIDKRAEKDRGTNRLFGNVLMNADNVNYIDTGEQLLTGGRCGFADCTSARGGKSMVC